MHGKILQAPSTNHLQTYRENCMSLPTFGFRLDVGPVLHKGQRILHALMYQCYLIYKLD